MAATQEKTAKKSKKPEPSMGKEELLKAYGKMLLIRRFEEKAGQLYGMGLIAGFCHLYIGQEAVVVGRSDIVGKPVAMLLLTSSRMPRLMGCCSALKNSIFWGAPFS